MATNINIEAPDEHIAMLLNAFNKSAGGRMCIEGDKEVNGNHFFGHWDFTIEPKKETETNKEYAARYIHDYLVAVIKMVEFAQSQDARNEEIALIPPATENVPDDIVIVT